MPLSTAPCPAPAPAPVAQAPLRWVRPCQSCEWPSVLILVAPRARTLQNPLTHSCQECVHWPGDNVPGMMPVELVMVRDILRGHRPDQQCPACSDPSQSQGGTFWDWDTAGMQARPCPMGRAVSGHSVGPWHVQAGEHGVPHLHEPPPSASPVPVSHGMHSWGRRGHVSCRDRPGCVIPSLPCPGPGRPSSKLKLV